METQMGEPAGQMMPELWKNRAAALYRLAFLMTGDRTRSLDVALEAIDTGDGTDSFFTSWMQAWSRRLVVAKVLSGIRDDLAASALRAATLRDDKLALPLPRRLFDADADGAAGQMESALLAIDLFPRCALLLTVFEGISPEDAAVLLNSNRDLVLKARSAGLQELARNLGGMRGAAYRVTRSCLRIKRLQHA